MKPMNFHFLSWLFAERVVAQNWTGSKFHFKNVLLFLLINAHDLDLLKQ